MNKRQKEVLQSQLDDEKKTLKDLKQAYREALEDCKEKIRELSARTDMENLQTIIYQKQYQEALKKQLEEALKQLQSDTYATISEYLEQCYQNGYIGTMYDLMGQGIPLIMPIAQEAVARAIEIDSKLSKGLYDRLGEDVDQLKATVRAEISRGIANGSSWAQVAKELGLSFRNTPFSRAYNNAMRIVRTEGHRVQIRSAMDAQKLAKSKGADVLKQWDATLDGKTREHHRMLDGQIREIEEPFEVAGLVAEAPGMFGIAAEDCNCRCALLQRARWMLDEDELEELKERAEFFGLDKTKDFDEFREKYLEASVEKEFKTLSLEEFKKMHHTVTKEERKILYGKTHFSGYINSSNARLLNGVLRSENTLNEEYQKIADTLSEVIQRNSISQDIVVTRYVTADALESIAGCKYPKTLGILASKNDIEAYWNTIESIPSQIKKGHKYKEKGFLSTSGVIDKNVMQEKQVRLNIKVPKGTKAYVTTNNKESEIIFDRGTCIEILNAQVENIRTSKVKIVLDCIMR